MTPDRLGLAIAEIDRIGQWQGSQRLDPIMTVSCGVCQDARRRQVIAYVYATGQGALLRAKRKRVALTDGTNGSAGWFVHFLDDDVATDEPQWWGNCPRHGRWQLPEITLIRAATRGSTLRSARRPPDAVG